MAMMMLVAAMTAVVILGWLVERFQRDIDAYHKRDYQAPPVFTSPPVG